MAAASNTPPAPWRVGVASEDITPPSLGWWLAGYMPKRRAGAVHRPLSARAVSLEAGGQRLVWVALDLLGVKNGVARRLRREVSEATGLPGQNLWVMSTHTHSGPDLIGLFGGPPPRYEDHLTGAVVRAVRRALASAQPARLRFGQAPLQDLALNRRAPHRPPYENTLAVLTGEAPGGQRLFTLMNAGIHPVVLGKEQSQWVSPDFPGALRETVEAAAGGLALFVNRAHGDVNPNFAAFGIGGHSANADDADRFGQALAAQALAVKTGEPLAARLTHRLVAQRPAITNPSMGLLALLGFGEGDHRGRLVGDFGHATLGGLGVMAFPGEVFGRLAAQVLAQAPDTGLFFGLQGGYGGYALSELDERPGGYEEKLFIGPAMPQAMRTFAAQVATPPAPTLPPPAG